ncbi:MAG: substrate-binding domain-containing protein [Burkholderiales bacterium]
MGDQPQLEENYLTVHQVAEYLHLNQKKIYAMVKDGAIPATKAAGKWLFPKKLIDDWLLESTHGGVLTDRLIVAGSDDPLLAAAIAFLAADAGESALIAMSPTGTRGGLELLSKRRANLCAIHWGPAEIADKQHQRLIEQYSGHREWALVRMAKRLQGIILKPGLAHDGKLASLTRPELRWAIRQPGAGSQHFLHCMLTGQQLRGEDLNVVAIALSERHAASLITQGKADCAPGVYSAASEFGLSFLPLGWECFDLVMPQSAYFRQLFQRLLALLGSEKLADVAASLQGYDLSPLGKTLSSA